MAGLTDTGFEPKVLTEIILERQASYRAAFGADINVNVANPDSAAGREIAIEAEREALVWDVLQALYLALDLSTAGGVLLDRLADVAGLTRKEASRGLGSLDLTGTNGTIIPAGTIAATESGIQVRTLADVTIASGVGTVDAEAVTPGAIEIASAAVTVKVSVVTGWLTVTNPDAFITGQDTETDTELRARIREPATNSSDARSPYDALLTEVLAFAEVEFATILVNADDFEDADGRPPHSFEVVVYGTVEGTPESAQRFVDAIWRHQLVGGRSYGSETGTTVDAGGGVQTIHWTEASTLAIEVMAAVTTYPALFPADGAQQIRDAVNAYVDGVTLGAEVTAWAMGLAVNGIPGIRSATFTVRKLATGSYVAIYTPASTEKPIMANSTTDIHLTVA